MKVALIAPPYPLAEAPSPPLGICYVAAACQAAGAEVKIFDYIVGRYTPEKLCRQVEAFQPDVVGATSVTLNFLAGAEILKTVKQHFPAVVTMMGGPHVSFDAENTLVRFPEIDLIVVGEAEKTLMQWLPAAKNRAAWHGIRGLAFFADNAFVFTGAGELIADLDALPLPARHLLPLSRYKALGFPISIITSRGCPNKCIFCLGRKMVGAKVRYRDPVQVADEIETLLADGFERINVADDLFTANKKRVAAVCGEILRRELRLGWSAFARVDTVDEETLGIMKKAGCDAVSFGIESGNPEMLARVKKRITLDQARQAVAACRKVGMIAHASFMVGLPGETRQSLEDSLNFARELNIEHGYHFLSPFPGTTVREHVDDYDLEILTDDWNRYDANSAIVKTSGLSTAEMEAFVARAYAPIVNAWEEKKARCAGGTATARERLEVDSEQRLNLIYQMLSSDFVEALGEFEDAQADPVERFSARIAEPAGMAPDFVARYIRQWLEKGYLRFLTDQGRIRWEWTPVEKTSPGPALG